MKKTLFILTVCSLIISSCSNEEQISDILKASSKETEDTSLFINKHEAELLSNQFTNWNNEAKTRGVEKQIINTFVIKSDEVSYDALMYIVNYIEGFTIISATKGIYPILAYSNTGSFNLKDTTNIGLSIWMNTMKNDIISEMNNPVDSALKLERYNYLKTQFTKTNKSEILTRAPVYLDEIRNYIKVGPLIATNWHQHHPYNQFIPNNYPAGCVPIALAQVINYHKTLSGENIDFASINNGSTSEAASLIKKIGTQIEMKYGSEGSYPDYCINPFNLFCYRERIANFLNNRGYKAVYTDNFNKRPNSLPVIYDAYKESVLGWTDLGKGHSWILDGYESYEIYRGWFETPETRANYEPGKVWSVLFFHFNWGWESADDTWYGITESYLGYSRSAKCLEIIKM